jgi:hypothetical protein
MTHRRFDRTARLLGDAGVERLARSTVTVFGSCPMNWTSSPRRGSIVSVNRTLCVRHKSREQRDRERRNRGRLLCANTGW